VVAGAAAAEGAGRAKTVTTAASDVQATVATATKTDVNTWRDAIL
jgi:hypothetical protein